MTRDRLLVVGARIRGPIALLGLALVAIGVTFDRSSLVWVALPMILGGLALHFLWPPLRRSPRTVVPPVQGRWLAVNSPATKVPSHGTHAYGQSYAIDLLHDPDDTGSPRYGWWPLARPARRSPSFAQPVLAPAEGRVVTRTDWQRDHWSRSSWPALAYFFVEGMLREITGPSRVLGNHLVLQLDDGTYAVLAHLRRRSITVDLGARVRAGEVVALSGNSGNSTEPHLHVQLMDHRWPLVAAGVPFVLTSTEIEDGRPPGLPQNGKHLVASPPHPRS